MSIFFIPGTMLSLKGEQDRQGAWPHGVGGLVRWAEAADKVGSISVKLVKMRWEAVSGQLSKSSD